MYPAESLGIFPGETNVDHHQQSQYNQGVDQYQYYANQ